MKIGVYAISKNEEKHVKRCFNSCLDADKIVLMDTGSTDKTLDIAREMATTYPNIEVYEKEIKPWRFDIARNESLALLPEDYDVGICLDLDEVMCKDWRYKIERDWQEGWTNRLWYKFIWNFKPDGTPDKWFMGCKIHARNALVWKHPVHEVMYPRVGVEEHWTTINDLVIEHHADNTKSRGSYLPLLEMAVAEDPHNDRNMHYLAREYYYYRQWDKCIETCQRHLNLPAARWDEERAASWRYMAKSLAAQNKPHAAVQALVKATQECPHRREPWCDLGIQYYNMNKLQEAYLAFKRALEIDPMTDYNYLTEDAAQRGLPHDYMTTICWNLGLQKESREHCALAYSFNPHDERLKANFLALHPNKAA